jgi:hypothetical protein
LTAIGQPNFDRQIQRKMGNSVEENSWAPGKNCSKASAAKAQRRECSLALLDRLSNAGAGRFSAIVKIE